MQLTAWNHSSLFLPIFWKRIICIVYNNSLFFRKNTKKICKWLFVIYIHIYIIFKQIFSIRTGIGCFHCWNIYINLVSPCMLFKWLCVSIDCMVCLYVYWTIVVCKSLQNIIQVNKTSHFLPCELLMLKIEWRNSKHMLPTMWNIA